MCSSLLFNLLVTVNTQQAADWRTSAQMAQNVRFVPRNLVHNLAACVCACVCISSALLFLLLPCICTLWHPICTCVPFWHCICRTALQISSPSADRGINPPGLGFFLFSLLHLWADRGPAGRCLGFFLFSSAFPLAYFLPKAATILLSILPLPQIQGTSFPLFSPK